MKYKHLLLTVALILLQSFVTFSAANGETLFLQSSEAQHIVSIEAEHFNLNTSGPEGHSWQNTSGSNYSDSAAMVALPEDRVFLDPDYAGTSPVLSYQVSFVTAGTHYLWVRGFGPSTSSDSLHVGMDGVEVSTGSNFNGFSPTGSLAWSGKSNGVVRTLQVATAGVHTINVWMRESGMVFDKLVLTSDAAYVPSGTGPAESLQAAVFQQDGAGQHLVSIEAEHFSLNTSGPEGHSWQNTSGSNYSGSAAMVALPEDPVFLDPDYAGTSPVLSYQVSFVTAGTHYLWVRGLGPSTSSDSLHVGMDGVEVSTGSNFNGFSPTGSLAWSGKSNGVVRTLQVATTGVHTINVWMRESGMVFDKLVLTSDAAYVPSATGPAESLPPQSQPTVATPSISPNGGTFSSAVTVSLATTTSGAQIYYTVDGTTPSQASTLYSDPFLLSTSGMVKAAAFLTGYTASQVATAEFVIGNAKPTLNSIGDKVVTEKQPLSFTVTASDSDLSIPVLSANLNDLPAGAVFVDNGDGTGSFSWTPQTGDAAGSPYVATFKATDAVDPLLSVQETISITVTQTDVFQQGSTGQHIVSIEAEHFHLNTSGPEGHSWQNTSGSNYSGSAAMVALPEDPVFLDPDYAGTSPVLSYQVSFVTAGTHYLWVRGLGPSTSSDSLHVGMDGVEVSTGSNFNGFLPTGSLAWSGTSNGVVRTLQVATAGIHTINVWMRESGMVIDKLVLTSDAAYVPSATGPAESLPTESLPTAATPSISPNGGTFSSVVTVSLATTTSGAQIYYTVDGTTPSQASTLYSDPFLLSTSGTVKAAAFFTGYTASQVATAEFVIGSESVPWPTAGWQNATPQEMGMDPVKLAEARDYALSGGGSGYIVKNGNLVFSWGSNSQRYDVKSVTKSIGGIALGLALKDGLVHLNDLAQSHLPDIGNPPVSNLATGWLDDITLFQLATQTAGFDKPGGYVELLYEPGSVWAYSDGGVNWLADILTVTNGRDLNEMIFSRVFTPLGITEADLVWRLNAYRSTTINGIIRREFGAGISIDVDAMARIGYLFLNNGRWENNQLIPPDFTDMVSTTNANVAPLDVENDLKVKYENASKHYGLMWWNNSDGSMSGVPRDAFWAWGLGDNIILVIPSLNIVASRAGSDLAASHSPNYYSALEPFFTSIVAADKASSQLETDVFQQDSAGQHLVSIEAEHFSLNTSGPEGHSWQNTSGSNYSGSAAMVALPEDRVFLDPDYAGTSPVLSYQVSFVTAGTHYLWVRGLGPSTSSDSLHVGMDGVEVSTGSNFNGFSPTGSLAWSGKSNGVVRTLQVATTGVHTINVWMRESGMVFDKLVLTSDAAYVPSGTGPAESLPPQSQPTVATPSISPNGGTFSSAVTVSLATTTSGAEIYYTVDGTTPSQASTLYSDPFLLSTSGTVKAAAFLTGYTASQVATAEFVIGNAKPTLNSIGDKVVTEKQPLSFTVTASDSDLSIPVLSANLNDLPAGAVFVDNGDGTGSFSWTPQTGDAAGSPYVATFKATDAVDPLLSVQETISITVTQTDVFQQGSTGQHIVSIEAEHFHLNTSGPEGHSWQNTSSSNYSGSAAMVALPEDRVFLDPDYADTSPMLSYQVSFVTAGTHYLWVRGLGPSTSSDSLHVGMDGVEVSTGSNFNGFSPTGSLAWSGKSNGVVRTLQVATTGVHTINVWMRESGMVFDKLVLTSDAAYVPSGTGPAESLPTESLPTVLDESFSSDTLVNYSIIPTNTQGGIGQVLYDPDWQCLQFITGSNVGIELVRNVGTLSSGQFSLEFWPSVSYSPGGIFSFRLKQDANNYYEVKNSDVGGTGIFRKVVAGVVVDAVVIQDEYIQDKNYHLLINFSPQSTKVLAFGKFYTLDTNSADIAVKTLEIEFAGQDGYIDNIRYAAELNDYYVAMGDSITLASFHDDISSDGIGYQPILATRLAEDKDYPHTVVNKGVSGEDSAAGLLRLPNLLQAYPQSRFFLIQYGTNDVLYGLVPSGLGLEPGDTGYPGSFKDNMQQIIDQIKAADKIPMLAKVPKAFGTRDYLNPTLQVFNAVIDELVNENYIGVTPPNFYCHFENNPDEMDDTLHPNGTGFISMANIWYEVLTDSYGGCSP